MHIMLVKDKGRSLCPTQFFMKKLLVSINFQTKKLKVIDSCLLNPLYQSNHAYIFNFLTLSCMWHVYWIFFFKNMVPTSNIKNEIEFRIFSHSFGIGLVLPGLAFINCSMHSNFRNKIIFCAAWTSPGNHASIQRFSTSPSETLFL